MDEPARDGEMTEEAAEVRGRAELRALEQSWRSAKSTLRETVIDAVEVFKNRSDELNRWRAQTIQQLSCDHPRVADELFQSHQIPDHSYGVFVSRGIVVSYRPQSNMATGISPSLSQSGLHPDNINYVQATSSEPGKLVLLGHSSSLISQPPPNTMLTTPSDTTATSGPRPRSSRLRPLKTTEGPIKTPEVRRGNYWIFEYRTPSTYGFYVMRCASSECVKPVFSKNPLCEERAQRHLRECCQPFTDVDDMVVRYARPVITGRKDNGKERKVTRSWARKHNNNLLAENEKHLERENFEED